MKYAITLRYLPVFLAAAVFSTPIAHAVPSDFDNDGISDLVTVAIGSDKKLSWSAKLSSTNQSSDLGTLGVNGNHIAMAQWLPGGTQIGVVSLVARTKQIRWTIKTAEGELLRKTFGEKGDLVVSGADFNGNGTADAAVARVEDGRVLWEIWYDMFATTTANKESFSFGLNGDRAFFARVGNDAVDWIGVIRRGGGNRSTARMRNLVTKEVRQFTRLPKFASTGDRPRALPVRQDSGPDLLAFHTERSKATAIRVFRFNGTAVGRADFSDTGTPVVGQFSTGPGFEIAFLGAAESGVFNPSEAEIVEIGNTNRIPVDEININTVGRVSTPNPGDSDGGSGGEVTSCSTTVPWPGSHIYKKIGSTHFSPGDVRRNTIGVILRAGASGPFPSCIDAITSKGQVIAKLGLYSRNDGWAARYYAGWGCGVSTAFNGDTVAARARAANGSSQIFLKFEGVCYGPIDASRCVGSSQC